MRLSEIPSRRWPSVGAALVMMAAAMVPAAAVAAAEPYPLIDGEPWIVYDGGGIRLIRPDGSDDHALFGEVPGALHPDWSPDGTRIAFAADDADGTRDLWVGSADGTGIERLYDCVAPCDYADDPAWSPDGGAMLFQRGTAAGDAGDGVGTVDVLDLASGELRTLVSGDPGDWFYVPRWSPDGDSIVVEVDEFVSARLDESATSGSTIAVVDLRDDPASVRELLPREQRASYPDWSPSGEWIVFQMPVDPALPSGPSDLHLIEPSGEGLSSVTTVGLDGRQALQPTWTPDGARVIFVEQDADFVNVRMATVPPTGGDPSSATGGVDLFGTHPRSRPGSATSRTGRSGRQARQSPR